MNWLEIERLHPQGHLQRVVHAEGFIFCRDWLAAESPVPQGHLQVMTMKWQGFSIGLELPVVRALRAGSATATSDETPAQAWVQIDEFSKQPHDCHRVQHGSTYAPVPSP
jgi:hypothetical protein